MPKVQAGRLRHRVTLFTAPTAEDGQTIFEIAEATPVDRGTFWAEVEALQGRELEIARQVTETISHRITMRVVAPIAAKDHLLFPGIEPGDAPGKPRRKFNIVSALRMGEIDSFYVILATEQP